MPFYEYECQSCKFYSEVMQRISDPPLKKCPSCGRNTMKKLISAPNFRLKGGGWYETDFKSDKEAKHNLAESDKAGKESTPAADAGAKAAETPPAKESKSSESKSAPETASRRSVAVSRTPARAEPRRGAQSAAKSTASRGASRRPGSKSASRSVRPKPARGKSRR